MQLTTTALKEAISNTRESLRNMNVHGLTPKQVVSLALGTLLAEINTIEQRANYNALTQEEWDHDR